MSVKKFKKSKSADFVICVTSVKNATWQGKAEHVESGDVHYYRSFLELLTIIHNKLENLGYPQPDMQLRSWGENSFFSSRGTEREQVKEEEKLQPAGGSTFLVRILFRQNTTWQGTVQSLDKNQTTPFRSLLELIMLIDEAVTKPYPELPDSI